MKTTLTYTFYEEDGDDGVQVLAKATDAQLLIHSIDNHIRSTLKHSDEGWLEMGGYEYLEGIREMIVESGAYVTE